MNSLDDTDFGAWLEAQLQALVTGAWAALDIPHLCDELDGVRRHDLQEPEWSVPQLSASRLHDRLREHFGRDNFRRLLLEPR